MFNHPSSKNDDLDVVMSWHVVRGNFRIEVATFGSWQGVRPDRGFHVLFSVNADWDGFMGSKQSQGSPTEVLRSLCRKGMVRGPLPAGVGEFLQGHFGFVFQKMYRRYQLCMCMPLTPSLHLRQCDMSDGGEVRVGPFTATPIPATCCGWRTGGQARECSTKAVW